MSAKGKKRTPDLPWRKIRREVEAELYTGRWLYLGADGDPATQILLAVRRGTLSPARKRPRGKKKV